MILRVHYRTCSLGNRRDEEIVDQTDKQITKGRLDLILLPLGTRVTISEPYLFISIEYLRHQINTDGNTVET